MSRCQLILEFITREFKGQKFFWKYLKEFVFSLWAGLVVALMMRKANE
jgi:hypothetical protein